MDARVLAAALVLACLAAACERERRAFDPPANEASRPVAAAETRDPARGGGPYRGNAWGIAEGKRLFSAYNCVGCHAHGGGGMGPALIDDRWIYGIEDEALFRTIADGRPNGMPAFGPKLSTQQVWMLVAYVQAMSGNAPMDVLPGRDDHLQAGTPENVRPAERPRVTGPR